MQQDLGETGSKTSEVQNMNHIKEKMMRISKNLPLIVITFILFAALSLDIPSPTQAEANTVKVGPWTFDEAAFADNATDVLGVNKSRFEGVYSINCLDLANYEECLDLAVTGFTPETYLGNVGNYNEENHSNLFQLDFTDLKAENISGPDIVFFDCHYDEENNPFEIAVRPEGGVFTDFILYSATDFEETDVYCVSGVAFNWGAEIDLSDFGLDSGTIVDALQFKSISSDGFAPPEGDPTMAAVLLEPPFKQFLPVIFRP